MSLFRNAISLLATSAVTVPIALASGIILARYLGPDDYGHYRVAVAALAVIVVFARLGWPSAAIFRIRRVGTPVPVVATSSLLVAVAMASLIVPVCWLLRERISTDLLQGAPPLVFMLVVFTVPFSILGLYFSSIARGIDRFDVQNWYRIALAVGQLCAATGILVIWERGLVEMLVGLLVVYALAGTGLTLAVIRHTGLRPLPDFGETLSTLRFGIRAWAYSLVGNLHERVDVFMLAYLLKDSSQVAYYAIAASIIGYLKMIPESIAVAALPELSSATADQSGELAARVVRHALLWIVLSIIAAAPTIPFLIPVVYGDAYATAVSPFLILLPSVGFLTCYRILVRYFLSIERQEINTVSQLFSTSLNVGLNFWLIPQLGVRGAALASVISYATEALILFTLFLWATRLPASAVLVFRRRDLDPYLTRVVPLLRKISPRR